MEVEAENQRHAGTEIAETKRVHSAEHGELHADAERIASSACIRWCSSDWRESASAVEASGRAGLAHLVAS